MPGRPCSFPFGIKDCGISNPDMPTKSYTCESFNQSNEIEYSYSCSSWLSPNKPWCGTQTYLNNSKFVYAWGYCKPECNGQYPHKRRPENLAAPAFKNLWKTRMFNLNSFLAGHCHTYTANEFFNEGSDGRLAVYGVFNAEDNKYRGWKIYIHSKQASHCRWFKILLYSIFSLYNNNILIKIS